MSLKPHATYRLQLRPGFGLDQAREVVGYLASLGISHLYTSPFLQAAADSIHGYDVVDPSKINLQLGDDQSFKNLCQDLANADLSLMIDIVPNHMAIVGKQNPWWWDILENGSSSLYASYFDVDWDSSEERWPNKILLPVLSDHYGRILEDKQFKISYEDGHFVLHYHDNRFPIDPSSLPLLLSRVAEKTHSEILAFLAESYARLPRPTVKSRSEVQRRHRDKAVLLQLLRGEEQNVLQAILQEVEVLNNDIEALDHLIQQQNYRLAFWRTASKELGYRRFFDIKELAGLRAEEYEVFRASHILPMKWYIEGYIQGLRIDHPDGLFNPRQYFMRLAEEFAGSWVVAEKILEPGETLPSNWKVQGTTGYDFLNTLTNIYIDTDAEKLFTQIYHEFIGRSIDFNDLVYECKLLVIHQLFGSEIQTLTHLFIEICEKHRCYRDYTRTELKMALTQTAACFPVYRSYVSYADKLVSPEDRAYVKTAIDLALSKKPDMDSKLLGFLQELLLLQIEGELEGEFAMRFQQFTGPVMAKGFEDTALYRYHRLIALNEVGGNPSIFGISLQRFHDSCLIAKKQRPLSLLASTTHDTKRSEDVRARLCLLSEIPAEWKNAVNSWKKHNASHRLHELPDNNTEYLLYQTLVGAWPIGEERLLAYMEKAFREAKEHTSWTQQNKENEESLFLFIKSILADKTFITDLENFITPLVLPGRINGLAQTLIKLTAPGIPDIYQGSELWNMSLVDPDNRRKVDFAVRQDLLNQLKSLTPQQILSRIDEGLPKLWIIQQILQFRKHDPYPFGPEGAYEPLYAKGKKAPHLIAFMRGETAITLAPRLVLKLNNQWKDTVLEIPKGTWLNLLTHEQVQGGVVSLENLFKTFPVAFLIKEKVNNA